MKIIIDTSVLIAYSLNNEKAIYIFDKIKQGDYTMYVSPDILFEYKNVLRLRKLKLSPEYQSQILALVKEISQLVKPDKEVKFSRDKYDSPFLSISEFIKADILFTEDKTLQKAGHLISATILGLGI